MRLLLVLPLFLILLLTSTAQATVDGGITAELLGTAHDGRVALVLEATLQEDCQYAPCAVYQLDTKAKEFRRRALRKLPARAMELEKELCPEKTTPECGQRIAKRMQSEHNAAPPQRPELTRYLRALTFWQRSALGAVAPPPLAQKLREPEGLESFPAELTLDELGPDSLSLSLQERWTAPSYRATTESGEFCFPERRPECKKGELWEDGQRMKAWSCPAPQERQAGSPSVASTEDCSGRASFVQVSASRDSQPKAKGRSVWVAPGRLAQAAMSLIKDRTVDLQSLQFSRHALSVYRLPHATLIVGGFAHGIFANGTWFPVLVALPRR